MGPKKKISSFKKLPTKEDEIRQFYCHSHGPPLAETSTGPDEVCGHGIFMARAIRKGAKDLLVKLELHTHFDNTVVAATAMNNKELFSCVLGGAPPMQHMHACIYMSENEVRLFCHTGSKNSFAGISAARQKGFRKRRAFLHNTGMLALPRKVTAFSCHAVLRDTECCARSCLHGACLESRTHSYPSTLAWSILMCLAQYRAWRCSHQCCTSHYCSAFHLRDLCLLS